MKARTDAEGPRTAPLPHWSLRIYGIPLPQARPRAFLRGKHVRMYDPDTSRDWKRTIIHEAAHERPAELLTGPLYVSLVFYLPRPKSAPSRVTQPTSKPDLDNLTKSVKDALRGIVYLDDSQIVTLEASKCFARLTDPPGVHIEVFAGEGEGAGDRARAKRMAVEARTPPPETSGRGRPLDPR